MALNIKNAEVERLAAAVAEITGESKTEAIRIALEDRKRQLRSVEPHDAKVARIRRFLEREVWPHIPPGERGRRPTREEEDEILGYGPHGV